MIVWTVELNVERPEERLVAWSRTQLRRETVGAETVENRANTTDVTCKSSVYRDGIAGSWQFGTGRF